MGICRRAEGVAGDSHVDILVGYQHNAVVVRHHMQLAGADDRCGGRAGVLHRAVNSRRRLGMGDRRETDGQGQGDGATKRGQARMLHD